jgi:hypothetical protein
MGCQDTESTVMSAFQPPMGQRGHAMQNLTGNQVFCFATVQFTTLLGGNRIMNEHGTKDRDDRALVANNPLCSAENARESGPFYD